MDIFHWSRIPATATLIQSTEISSNCTLNAIVTEHNKSGRKRSGVPMLERKPWTHQFVTLPSSVVQLEIARSRREAGWWIPSDAQRQRNARAAGRGAGGGEALAAHRLVVCIQMSSEAICHRAGAFTMSCMFVHFAPTWPQCIVSQGTIRVSAVDLGSYIHPWFTYITFFFFFLGSQGFSAILMWYVGDTWWYHGDT